jgi:hypothetical protein
MDSVDKVFYDEVTVPSDVSSAYQIFNSKDGAVVLKDLTRILSWGAQDPLLMNDGDAKAILASQKALWRIKAMLNSKPERGEENE